MHIYTLVTVVRTEQDHFIHNVIASYTDGQAAIKEKEWRQRSERPEYLDPRYPSSRHSAYARSRYKTYEIIRTELITDKFTEFALGARNEQSDTD